MRFAHTVLWGIDRRHRRRKSHLHLSERSNSQSGKKSGGRSPGYDSRERCGMKYTMLFVVLATGMLVWIPQQQVGRTVADEFDNRTGQEQ